MKILILAREEIRKGKLAWLATLLLGLSLAALPHLPLSALRWIQDLSGAVASLQIGCALALAGVLGAVMFPADLARGRLGFYLTRPVGLPTLVAGRFLGAWALAAGGAFLAGLPDLLLHPAHRSLLAAALLAGSLASIPALLAGHLLGMVGFARTPWLLLDLLGIGVSLRILIVLLLRLQAASDFTGAAWLIQGAACAFLTLMVLATALQMALGRGNLRKGHRVVSLTMATGFAVFFMGASWVVAHRLAHPTTEAHGTDQKATSH